MSLSQTLAQLHAQCFARGWSAQEFDSLIERTGAVLVSRQHGFALAMVTLDEAELLTIATRPSARRSGLGSDILRDLVSNLHTRNVTRLFLEVAEDNAPARALYAKFDFREVGRRRGYYPRPEMPVDALVLSKAL